VKRALTLLLALALAAPALAQTKGDARTNAGDGLPQQGVILGQLRLANFNSTSDQAIPMPGGRYIIRRIVIHDASTSLTTAAGGFYPSAAKAGTAIVSAGQTYTVLTGSTKYIDTTLRPIVAEEVYTLSLIYFSLTTPQGAAATASITVYGDYLP
jgi:hypothetical protein